MPSLLDATVADDLSADEENWFECETETDALIDGEKPAEQTRSNPLKSVARPTSRTELSALFFDIETVPDYSRIDSFGLDPLPEIRPESGVDDCPPVDQIISETLDAIRQRLSALNPVDSYLDLVAEAEKSAKKPRVGVMDAVRDVRKAREAIKNAPRDRAKLLSVTPEYCRIAAIGWASGSKDVESLTCGEHAECDTADERALLEAFWSLALDARPLIGFNVLSFDLRVIFVRSALLGVMPSRLFDLKPWGRDIIDLMLVRFGSMSQAMGLKKLAPLYGIEIPAGDCDGSQVAELMTVNPKMVAEYVRSDVQVTRELYRKLSGYFCP